MKDYKHYVPILKGKEGEFRALSKMSSRLRNGITPLIDIPRIDLNVDTGRPVCTVEIHMDKKAKKISACWPKNQSIIVDGYDLEVDLATSDGVHFMDYLFRKLRWNRTNAIPAIGLDRYTNPEYLQAIQKIVNEDRRGVCVRLLKEDMETPRDTYTILKEIVALLRLPASKVHLLLDLRSVSESEVDEVADIATYFLSDLPSANGWQMVTIAASGFPENLGCVGPDSVKYLARSELLVYRKLRFNKNMIKRFPSFGDYGICHPDLLDFDPRIHRPSAAIRYTLEKDWLIIKARSLKKYKFNQFFTLSDKLRKRPEFYGSGFSWGDNYISECADCAVGCGNLMTWRQVGTNHHLTLVSEQIAS